MELYTFKNIILPFIVLTSTATANAEKENGFQFYEFGDFSRKFSEKFNTSVDPGYHRKNLSADIVIRNANVYSIDFLRSLLTSVSLDDASYSKCVHDLQYWFKNTNFGDLQKNWALKMFDSFGKPDSGILEGNLKWIGDFEECLSIHAPKDSTGYAGDFRGKYCSVQVPLSSFSVSVGICLPDSCDPADFTNINSSLFNSSKLLPDQNLLKPLLKSLSCKPNTKKLTNGAIFTICLISMFLIVVLIGSSITVFRYLQSLVDQEDISFTNPNDVSVNNDLERQMSCEDSREPRAPPIQVSRPNDYLTKLESFLNCFCVFTNGAKLLSTDSAEGELLCLHGIRFLSMSWIILCHVYGAPISILRSAVNVKSKIDNLPFEVVLNGFFSVDAFFLLSGFLIAFLYFQKASKNNGSIPWVYFYVHRYLRLTPVYMIVLAFYATVLPLIASGPFWPDYDVDPLCQKNWWWNPLYINNFLSMFDRCMGYSWYLSNDMQFFVISPLFLISLWRWPIIGYIIMGIFLVASCVVSFAISYHFKLTTGIGDINNLLDPDFLKKFGDYFDIYYIKPYTRIGPYLIGIALAYILYKRSLAKRKISFIALCIGWILATIVGLLCIYGLHIKVPAVLGASFYNSLSRICYASCLSWVIFVCLSGRGGIVDKILSYKLFIPLSRLTYSAYLIHLMLITIYFNSTRATFVFSHLSMVTIFLGLLLLTYALSLSLSLVFESPIIRLEKLMRSKFQS